MVYCVITIDKSDVCGCDIYDIGELPGEIGQLSRLLKLSLNGNRFTSSIPHEFASSLHRLTMLKMDENLLTGTIPDSFSKLTSIKYMYLYDNRLTGTFYWYYLNNCGITLLLCMIKLFLNHLCFLTATYLRYRSDCSEQAQFKALC